MRSVKRFKKDVKVELLKLDPINSNTEFNTAEIEFLSVELTGRVLKKRLKIFLNLILFLIKKKFLIY